MGSTVLLVPAGTPVNSSWSHQSGCYSQLTLYCAGHCRHCAFPTFQGFPTIKFLYVSNGKIKSSAFNGGRSAKELVTFALDKVGVFQQQEQQQDTTAAAAAAARSSTSREGRTRHCTYELPGDRSHGRCEREALQPLGDPFISIDSSTATATATSVCNWARAAAESDVLRCDMLCCVMLCPRLVRLPSSSWVRSPLQVAAAAVRLVAAAAAVVAAAVVRAQVSTRPWPFVP